MSGVQLTQSERDTLLRPCDCGHDLDAHGGVIACWRCEDNGRSCATGTFEDLLCERVAVVVEGRVKARLAGVEVCGDVAGSMTCTLRVDHRGPHVDERVFGSAHSGVITTRRFA